MIHTVPKVEKHRSTYNAVLSPFLLQSSLLELLFSNPLMRSVTKSDDHFSGLAFGTVTTFLPPVNPTEAPMDMGLSGTFSASRTSTT